MIEPADEPPDRRGSRVRLGDWRSPLVLVAWLVSLGVCAALITLVIEIL